MDTYNIRIMWSDQEGGYIATSPEFKDLSAFGATAREAAAQFESVVRVAIQTYRDSGRALPEPKRVHEHSRQLRGIVTVLRQADGIRGCDGGGGAHVACPPPGEPTLSHSTRHAGRRALGHGSPVARLPGRGPGAGHTRPGAGSRGAGVGTDGGRRLRPARGFRRYPSGWSQSLRKVP